MANYTCNHPEGTICTRYSELTRCTPGQVDRVLADRESGRTLSTDNMLDGSLRHEMFEQEAKITGKLPACFGLDWPVSHIEQEFTTELVRGVVVHSRPDTVCADVETVVDYKTVLDGANGWKANVEGYRHASKQRQLFFYAYQLGLHGIRIRKGVFLCEIWNKGRDEILGYERVEFPITLMDMAGALNWAKPRIALLASELELAAI